MFYLQIVLTFLWRTPQPVTVQFVPKGVCFLCVVRVLVDVIDLAYFHSAYFYILLPALSVFFFAGLQRGWVQRFVKADLRRATFPPPQAVYTKLSPADGIWKAETLVPFITHPGRNCFCPSQWGFGCISNYQKDTVLDPQGHGRDEKRCRCEEVPFHSINTLFIGCACLSEEQRYLYPRQNITDAGWIMTRFVWIRAEALCFIARIARSRILSTSFHFCNFKILFDSLTSPPYFGLKAQYTSLWQPLSPINVPQHRGMKPGVGDTSTAL